MKVMDVRRGNPLPYDAEEEQAMGNYYAKHIECDNANLAEMKKIDISHIKKKSILNHLSGLEKRYDTEHKKLVKWFNKQKEQTIDYKRYSLIGPKRTWFLPSCS